MRCKRFHFHPHIPEWEKEALEFSPLDIPRRDLDISKCWVNYRGEFVLPPENVLLAESIVENDLEVGLQDIYFRDPRQFVAGNIHNHLDEWERMGLDEEARKWLREGVNVEHYFRKFKGNFKGKNYDCATPPEAYFPNSSSCRHFGGFISSTIIEKIKSGTILVWGKVGDCVPPHLILPLTVEHIKPRLCHDERFLNLWVMDKPFQLDTLKELPRLVGRNHFMASVDDKSGYDHVRVSERSKSYFGFQFGGWFFVYNTIPFGFKLSAYIYQKLGYFATAYCRRLGVPCLQYIDDRMISEWHGKSLFTNQKLLVLRSIYIVCQLLVRLGYFLALEKCVLIPTKILKYLGLLIDSQKLAFLLPEEKRNRFAELRDFILSEDSVDIKTLQRFAGKCISFVLVVPASRLYSREVHRAIGMAERNSRRVEVVGALREEIEFWKFLDNWNGFVSWRSERHLQISLATDSSGYKWGALVFSQKESFGDFWGIDDKRPIHLKEGDALLNALLSLGKQVENHRVDAYVDNKALVHVWENQGGKDVRFNNIMKSIFVFTEKNNVDLKLHFIPSGDNAADGPSRSLSFQDCQLSGKSWSEIQLAYGPHSVDLMALDSNVMLNERGEKLRHFTQGPSPLSSGINVFSQDVSLEDNPYVFPPFCLISVLLKFLESQRVKKCTVVVPEIVPTPVWWPLFWLYVESFIVLGNKGDTGVLKLPSKQGFVLDKVGLKWKLIAGRLSFSL